MIFRSLVLFSALASAVAADAASEPRAPTAKWVVNFADAQCIAHRDYGTEKGAPRLVLKAPPLGDVMQVAILRHVAPTAPEQVGASIVVDQRPPLKTSLMMYTPPRSKQRVYLLNMPSADFAAVRQAKILSVRSQGLNETFALSQMESLMKVMDKCVANLRQVFNIAGEGAEPPGLRSRARANIAKVFSSDDYPAVAIRNDQSGRVRFALLIQEDGRVADCTIVATSGVPALDSQACAILKARARFEPARGSDGKPAKDSVVGSILWRV
jgi:TonB family protein